MSRLSELLRPELRGKTARGAPQLDVPVRLNTNENSYPVPETLSSTTSPATPPRSPRTSTGTPTGSSPSCGLPSRRNHHHPGVDVVADEVWAGNGSTRCCAPCRRSVGLAGLRSGSPGLLDAPDHHRDPGTTWVDGLRGAARDAPFDLTAESAVAQVREHRPNVVFLCSPNNPTGTALSLEVVAAVYDAAPTPWSSSTRRTPSSRGRARPAP